MPFEIPDSWEWTTIKEVCSKIGSGSTPRGSNYSLHGIPFFRSQNIYNNGLVYDDIKYISPEVHENMISTEVRANDVLLNITGGSLGRCAIAPSNFERGNVSQHVCILRPVQVLSAYLHYFCISTFFTQTMTLSGSGREGLPKYSLEQMQIPIPPLQEQNRIVEEIERWNILIDGIDEDKQELLDFLQLAKSKVLSLAISGKLVPQDPNDEPAIDLLKRINPSFKPCDTSHYENLPSGWAICRLSDIAKISAGGTPSRKISSYWEGGTIPWLKIADMTASGKYVRTASEYITEEGMKNSSAKLMNKGTLLYTIFASIGEVGILDFDATCNQAIANIDLYMPEMTDYIYYYLKNLQTYMYSISKGCTQQNINQGILKNATIPLPPLAEQKRIVERIETIFAQLDTITAEL